MDANKQDLIVRYVCALKTKHDTYNLIAQLIQQMEDAGITQAEVCEVWNQMKAKH